MPDTTVVDSAASGVSNQSSASCRICGSAKGSTVVLTELLYGTGEQFDYWHCEGCGSFQIVRIPEDLGRYYPADYYSFAPTKMGFRRAARLVAARLGRQIGVDLLRKGDFLSGLSAILPRRGGRVVDVGSGSGQVTQMLSVLGYDCTCLDPYASAMHIPHGVRFLKCTMDQVQEDFDLMLLLDSLEHMPDPHQAFADIARMLRPKGTAHARVPVLPNNIWDTYGLSWYGLDPPRHLYTFTLEALRHLAREHGLEVQKVIYDGRAWSLAAARTRRDNPNSPGRLSAEQLTATPEDVELTRRANSEGRGDEVFVQLGHPRGEDS
jgi:SAM-dependent methyltransferase